ncbi:hypothetical protein L596_013973 [Steinernema carpocapsae]|uniref:Uncharacterized protein n=1 Tax=Steinernema carpocapsae TaxID=34508 RepID=A0A4U5NA00_STECR|nr:hypothetical protein L596_013973 [Steinernema carpocapsae]
MKSLKTRQIVGVKHAFLPRAKIDFIDRILLTNDSANRCETVFRRMKALSKQYGSTFVDFRSKCHITAISLQNAEICDIVQKPAIRMLSKNNTYLEYEVTDDSVSVLPQALIRTLESEGMNWISLDLHSAHIFQRFSVLRVK